VSAPAPHAAPRVQRITLPRYEVHYPTCEAALHDAKYLVEKKIMQLPELNEAVGADVVLDLRATGIPMHATLLFRVLQCNAKQAVLEFWARRKTDTDLLELWLEALELGAISESGSHTRVGLSQTELHRAFDLCRRVLSQNPFVALGVHWSCGDEEVVANSAELRQTLERFVSSPALPEKVEALLQRAQARLPEVTKQLSTVLGRKAARARYVTTPQLAHARQMAEDKLVVAQMKQDIRLIRDASALVAELAPL
jgi:hypothetical protein